MKKSEQGSLVLSALEIQGPLINAIPQINLYKLNNRLLSSIVNKSVFAPSASPSHSLSKFPQHEVTRSITNTPWMGCWSSTPPQHFIKLSWQLASTHLYSLWERDTVREKCLSQ